MLKIEDKTPSLQEQWKQDSNWPTETTEKKVASSTASEQESCITSIVISQKYGNR